MKRAPRCSTLAAAALVAALSPAVALADEVAPIEPAEAEEESWDEPAPLDPDLDENYPERAHFAFRAQATAAWRMLYDTAIGAVDLETSLGADTRRGSFSASARFLAGRTDGGLTLQQFTLGPSFAWSIGRFALGPKVRIGYLWIDRVTSNEVIDAMSLGLAAALGYELYKSEGVTVSLTGELSADALLPFFEVFDDQPASAFYGANFGLQFRLRAPKAPRASQAAANQAR